MAAEVIPCPACRHDVRVPESLFGQPVRCPACKAYFTAPTRDAAGILGQAELLAEAPRLLPPNSDAPRSTMDQSPIFVPAILLLLVGIVGAAVNGIQAYQTFSDPEGSKARVTEVMKKFAEITKQEFKQEMADQVAETQPAVVLTAFFVSLVPLAGAVAMLRMQAWWLSILGSIFALFDFGSCCCLFGAPVGIYCLIKLFDPEIRAMFRQR
jgi:hypothetical protein